MRHQNPADSVCGPNPVAGLLRSWVSALMREWAPRSWESALLGVFAVFATLYVLITHNLAHQLWAMYAAVGYLVGAVVLLALPVRRSLPVLAHRRWVVGVLLVAGTVMIPLMSQVIHGIANPEIPILRETADRWLSVGTPFPSDAELASQGRDVNAYNVYLPLLTMFGMPSAVFGSSPITDPRIYLLVVSFVIFLWLGRRSSWPVTLFVISPGIALQLVSGGTDVPVLGFVLIGLVLVDRDRFGWAGVAMGISAGFKVLAWPAVAIVLLLVRARGGWRAFASFTGLLVLVLMPVLGLPVLADPAAFVVNALELPLGVLPVKLTADSPLPGHLLSQAGPVGQVVALVLLSCAALAIGGCALRRPPQDAATAARWIALGILVAVLLAPSTRYGYLIYSIGLLLFPVLVGDVVVRARNIEQPRQDTPGMGDGPAGLRAGQVDQGGERGAVSIGSAQRDLRGLRPGQIQVHGVLPGHPDPAV